MFLFNAEFSQGTVKLPAAVDYEDFWNIEPSRGELDLAACIFIETNVKIRERRG